MCYLPVRMLFIRWRKKAKTGVNLASKPKQKKAVPRKSHSAQPAKPHQARKFAFPKAYYTPSSPPPLPKLLMPYPNDPFPTPLVSSSATKGAIILTLLVPGLGHWLILQSRHTLGYLLLAFLAWFIAISAMTACWFECSNIGVVPIQAVFLLPIAMHVIAAYDVKMECGGRPQNRIMGHVF